MSMLIRVGPSDLALVDDDDWLDVSQFSWHATRSHGNCYARRDWFVAGRRHGELLHRRIMKTPRHLSVHHINHVGLDCRKENMLNVTTHENNQDMRISKRNTSGYVGVYYEKRSPNSPWIARVEKDYVNYSLGSYSTPEEANEARLTFLGRSECKPSNS